MLTLHCASHAKPDMKSHAEHSFPNWVPEAVQRYLTHTEAGLPIREVARRSGCHASTVLRQIRRIETRRDDPLVDRALCNLSARYFHGLSANTAQEHRPMGQQKHDTDTFETVENLEREAFRVLRRLCEANAVLAVAEGMETAVVVREQPGGATARTASVSSHYVQAMALNMWIEGSHQGKISRYTITHAGRNKVAQLLETYAPELDQSTSPFADQHREFDEKHVQEGGRRKKVRYNACESPVTALARRKDKEGAPFLSEALVTAAERLREDFELAQMGPRVAQNWDNFLTGNDRGSFSGKDGYGRGPSAARGRVADALRYLGPGLGDVALRCCCYLEGLESAEKRMGWSARSGKIVLRIALQRLAQFYDTQVGEVLIG